MNGMNLMNDVLEVADSMRPLHPRVPVPGINSKHWRTLGNCENGYRYRCRYGSREKKRVGKGEEEWGERSGEREERERREE